MSEALNVSVATLWGLALGAFFFMGLWWTVHKGVISARPAAVFLGSMVFRTGVVLVGFYYLGRGDWRNTVGGLIGFVLARFIVTRNARFAPQAQAFVKLQRAQ